jgi:glucosamine--fructose-6-phosphate aminotransferase (isomerizing)
MASDIATLREIHGQPTVWTNCLEFLQQTNLKQLAQDFHPTEIEWVFVGCGTSYYLAQAAAYSFSDLLHVPARAVPASEILLFPSVALPKGKDAHFPVLISRSGHTSEVLLVAEYLQAQGIDFLAVTCDGRELEALTPHVLKLPIHEDSTVMTSSFTGMLLGLQYLAATLANDDAFLSALHALPAELERLLAIYAPRIKEFAELEVQDVAFLGQGALYPIASETALKVMESSSTYAQFFHTLEFRHGPKSIVDSNALVGALVSETGYEMETSVLRDMKELGAHTLAVVNTASNDLHSYADLIIELNLSVPELARIAVYVVWGQLLGSHRGLKMGLNPDHPRNLSRVVTI